MEIRIYLNYFIYISYFHAIEHYGNDQIIVTWYNVDPNEIKIQKAFTLFSNTSDPHFMEDRHKVRNP